MKKSADHSVEENLIKDTTSRIGVNQKTKLFAGLVFVILLLTAAYLYNRYWIVAKFNDQTISRLEYIQAMEKQVGKNTLENMIIERLIISSAKTNNVTVPAEVLDQKIKEIEDQLSMQGSTLDATLAKEGMTREELTNQIRIQQLAEIMGQGNTDVSEDEIKTFLTENKDFLPEGKTNDELKSLAKDEIQQQKKSQNIEAWISNLRSSAQVVTN